MGIISRLYDFTAGQTIQSQQVDDELNQLVAAVNNVEPANLSAGVKNLFPQLASAASTKENFGTATIHWPGGITASDVLTVPHGLGKTPVHVEPTLAEDPGQLVILAVTSKDSTNFTVRARSAANVAVGNMAITWRAIG